MHPKLRNQPFFSQRVNEFLAFGFPSWVASVVRIQDLRYLVYLGGSDLEGFEEATNGRIRHFRATEPGGDYAVVDVIHSGPLPFDFVPNKPAGHWDWLAVGHLGFEGRDSVGS